MEACRLDTRALAQVSVLARCESLGTRFSRATGIIGVTQDLVDGRICILANTRLLVSIHCVCTSHCLGELQ